MIRGLRPCGAVRNENFCFGKMFDMSTDTVYLQNIVTETTADGNAGEKNPPAGK